MALNLDFLKKKYNEMLGAGANTLSSVGNEVSNRISNNIVKPYNQAINTGVNTAMQGVGQFANNLEGFIGGQRNLPQEIDTISAGWKKLPINPVVKATAQVGLGIAKPAVQGFQSLRDLTAMGKNDPLVSAKRSLAPLGLLGAAFSYTPAGMAWNLGPTAAAGSVKSIREGTGLLAGASEGTALYTQPSESIGMKPGIASTVLDIGLPILSGRVSSVGKSKSIQKALQEAESLASTGNLKNINKASKILEGIKIDGVSGLSKNADMATKLKDIARREMLEQSKKNPNSNKLNNLAFERYGVLFGGLKRSLGMGITDGSRLEAPRGVVGEKFVVPNLNQPLNRGQGKVLTKQTLKQVAQQELDNQPISGFLDAPKQSLGLNAPQPFVAPTISTPITKPKTKLGQVLQDIRTKFEDFTAPIEDALTDAEKQGKYNILPTQDVRYQIDRVLRADSLATQFAKDNGFVKVVQSVEDPAAFNQYLIAKQSLDVSAKGIKTGRDAVKDINLVKGLAEKYEGHAQVLYQYNQRLRNYLVESGLISKELSDVLGKEYPSYVPLKRVFDEVEQSAMNFRSGGGGPASIGSQSVVQKLRGSEREIVNPLESILENTAIAFREGERNKAANMMVGYVKNGILPGKILDAGETTVGKHTVSALVNGKKVMFETTEGIADAAKNLNQEQLSTVLKVMRIPTRILQMGATGLNVPFVASNLVKDQATAAVIGDKAIKTSLLNPMTFLKSFYSAVKKDFLYDEWVRSGSSYTSFDIARGQTVPTLNKIRASRSTGSKVAYTATHPAELFRALEDAIGTTENLTRIQQYAGTRADLLAKGRTMADADILGGAASRTNTANFARKGEYGKILNAVIPFLNAGIQGARSLRNAFARDPKGTSLRFGAFVGVPVSAVTLWNMSDPKRREAYDDIQEYEKESNIIIMPENPTQDANGRYNAIKIPINPGIANLASIIRRGIEGAGGSDPQTAMQILSDLFAAGTSITPPTDSDSTRKLLSGLTPQMAKVPLESSLNKNLYTGADIVPSYMKSFPTEMQVKDKTSGTARIVGKALNTSPLMVENAFSSGGAGVGRQVLNASDTVLNKLGVLPKEQVGGRSISQDFDARFASATGGQQLSNLYDGKSVSQSGTVQAQGQKSDKDLGIIASNGKYYVRNGTSVNSYDTVEDARLSVRKYEFKQSGKDYQMDEDYVFSKTPSGNITTKTRREYDADLNEAQMSSLKKNEDYKGWMELAEKQLMTLIEDYDTTEDPLEKVKLENKITTLDEQMEKYKGYGGFAKGKKPKALGKITIPKVKAVTVKALPKIKVPKVTRKRTKYARLTTIKRKVTPLKLPQIKLKYA